MPTTLETPLKAKTLSLSLTVDDLQKSITFFEGLGFRIEDRWEDNGALAGVMLRAGDASIGLSQDDWKKGRDRRKGVGVRILIETAQNIDEIAGRAKKAGVRLNSDPYDSPWGTRVFEATEPSGFLVTISSQS